MEKKSNETVNSLYIHHGTIICMHHECRGILEQAVDNVNHYAI